MKRSLLILAGLLLVLLAVNLSVLRYERILRDGDTVLLELAPVDPRSLMQGDYMRLRFALASELDTPLRDGAPGVADGYAVLALGPQRVASLVRIQPEAQPRTDDEIALRYRIRDGRVLIVTDAFFFEEGQAEHFAAARYGELRVASDGTALLTALRDADLAKL